MNIIKFKSKKSIFISIVVFTTTIGLSSICIFQLYAESNQNWLFTITMQLICWLCISFLLWIYFKTHYKFNQNYLYYRSGPFYGKIEIEKIKEIIIGQRFFVGFKPATGNRGLVIKYNRWDEIYISPDTNENFIAVILKINDKIKIVNLETKTG